MLLGACVFLVRQKDGHTISNRESEEAHWCDGYLAGVITTALLDSQLGIEKAPFCMPEGVSNIQVARVVVKHLQENPARLHESGLLHVLIALQTAFPCAKPATPKP